MKIPERIAELRREMKTFGMDAYIVPTADFHQSEYVGEYFKCREYITGFTGSAGTVKRWLVRSWVPDLQGLL